MTTPTPGSGDAKGGGLPWTPILLLTCAALVAPDLLHHKHGYFAIEKSPAFQSWVGLALGVALIVISRIVRGALGRPEGDDER